MAKDTKEQLSVYSDGAVVRWRNRRIVIIKIGEDFVIESSSLMEKGMKKTKPCRSKINRGVRVTAIKYSEAAMDAIVSAYISFKTNNPTGYKK